MNYHYLNHQFCCVFNRKRATYFFGVAFGILFLICMIIRPAHAHKVNIFAYAEDGKVNAEGYFVDGSKCKNSLIEVVDNKTGEKLLEGNTDDNGQFLFSIPRTTSIKLILHAGIGHQNEYILSEDEIKEAMPRSKQRIEKQDQKIKQTVPEPKQQKKELIAEEQNVRNLSNMNSRDLEEAVDKVLESKLQPIMRMLVRLQEKSEKPGLTEIIGGIGYIIGIIGIIAYFKGRSLNRKTRSK